MLKPALRYLFKFTLTAGLLLLLLGIALSLRAHWRLPDLSAWHQVALKHEFRAHDPNRARDFVGYLRQEARLFEELEREIYLNPKQLAEQPLARYAAGSVVAERALRGGGNRSLVRVHPAQRGVVLLLHGLTDAPYSLHAVADAFYAQSISTVALRLPGHGTSPQALLNVQWEDWFSAVELAANEASRLRGTGQPFFIVGYSTGAPLALLYSLKAVRDPKLPKPDHLLLISAALGISRLALLGRLTDAVSALPGLEKGRWLDVYPEIDPYKYNSFPLNGGIQIWRLTRALEAAFSASIADQSILKMPRVTAFQSLVDATVAPRDVLTRLFDRLPAGAHELVVFDLNRHESRGALIDPRFHAQLGEMRSSPARDYQVALISNRDAQTAQVVEFRRRAHTTDSQTIELGLAWPPNVLSLSHVALPFPLDDALYGLYPKATLEPELTLGGPAPRGEEGAMAIPLGKLARMRSNPFFAVIEQRIAQATATR